MGRAAEMAYSDFEALPTEEQHLAMELLLYWFSLLRPYYSIDWCATGETAASYRICAAVKDA